MIAQVWPISTVRTLVLILATLLFSSQLAFAQFAQQGPKLVGSGAVVPSEQGWSVALSGDGNTAIVGGSSDNNGTGAAWVYTRSGGVWTQQGDKLVGTGAVGSAGQGSSVALSADGNTAILGGPGDNNVIGAAWVFTRSGGIWTQQGDKLVGTGAVAPSNQGSSVAISADGNTAIMGGPGDNYPDGPGAAWVFTRSNGVWTQQGPKLVGTGAVGSAGQGSSVALSADGNTAILGGPGDNGGCCSGAVGAAWVFTRSGGVWTQQGDKLVGTGAVLVGYAVGFADQGYSVALSADGNTAILGGPRDNEDLFRGTGIGAAWVFTRSGGIWTQQGDKLVGTGAVAPSNQGSSVAISADGNTAILGGPRDGNSDGFHNGDGAAWVFTRSSGVWTQQGGKLVGTGAVGFANQGSSVAISADGNTAIVGGPGDNSQECQHFCITGIGAAWVFIVQSPSLQLTPTTDIVTSGNPGGPFNPSLFQYQLSATVGTINYSISGYPNWLTPSLTSGTASTTATSVTFTVNANANSLAVGTYGPTTITFTNTDTGQLQTRTATLTVNAAAAPALVVAPATNMAATGNQGGPFTPPSFQYQVSASTGSVNYSISGLPSWLSASPSSGTASSGTTVTFTVNPNANSLTASDSATITFSNMDTGQGTQTRMATLTVNPPGLQVSAKNIAASGQQGGPFSPTSFSYSLNATSGSVKYTITNVPKWLTETPASGTVTTRAGSVTFRINTAVADKLSVGTNISNIHFNNTNNQVMTRTATLTITPKNYNVRVIAAPIADGSVTGGGTFAGGTSDTVTATPKSGHTFVHWTENGRVVSTSESYTFTVSANVTLVADFR